MYNLTYVDKWTTISILMAIQSTQQVYRYIHSTSDYTQPVAKHTIAMHQDKDYSCAE